MNQVRDTESFETGRGIEAKLTAIEMQLEGIKYALYALAGVLAAGVAFSIYN